MTIRIIVLSLTAILFFSAPLLSAPSGPTALRTTSPDRFLRTEPLVLRAESADPLEWVMAFWKTPGADDYESLPLSSADGRAYEGRIDPSGLAEKSLVYYLAYKTGGRISYLPEGAPGAVFTLSDATPEGAQAQEPTTPPPAETPEPKPFPLRLEGSAEKELVQSEESSQATGFSHAHNLRLDYSYARGALALKTGARLSYMSQPVAGENAIDLPDFNIEAQAGIHSFRAGDLPLAESEFTIGPLGRRGLDYRLGTKAFDLHVFTLATQQVRGFKGIGWPTRSAASLFGGSFGLKLIKALTLKAIFLTGEDDPALGVNVGASSLFHRRKGNVLAFIGESTLLGDALKLEAEFAASRYDPNMEDGEDLRPGKAFRVRGAFRKGSLDAQAGYRSIDAEFNSVGLPMIVSDRSGFDAGAGLSLGRFRLSGSFRKDQTNVSGDPGLATAELREGRAEVSLGLGASSTIRFGYVVESQDASFSTSVWNPYPAFEGRVKKAGLSGGMEAGLASWLRLSLTGEKADVRCAQTPSMEGGQTAASLGIQVVVPDRLSLFPALSYSLLKQTAAGTETKSLMASLSGELTLIRRWLTWNAMAALSDTDSGPGTAMTSASADTGINLNLRPVLKLGDAIVSLRGQYMRSQMTGLTTETYRAAVRMTYSF